MDSARRVTDQQISAMRREFAADYDQLGGSMSAHLAEYLADFTDEEGRVEATALTGRKWARMRDQLAREATELNADTMRTLDGRLGEVRQLTAEGSSVQSAVPHPAIDQRADLAWNRRKVEAVARQGIGRTPAEAGERMRRVADMNSNATVRRVRTAVNGAENAGRLDAMLARGGSKRWVTMADERVRDSHAALHGKVVPVDEPFGNGLMFPGDPSGSPEEVYNCRCSIEWVDTADEVQPEFGEVRDAPMLDGFDQYADDYLREHADEIGLTAEQQGELADMLGRMYDQSEVYSYISMDALEDLSGGGHLMNAFELAEKRAAGDVSGGVTMSEAYSSARNKTVMDLFGKDATAMASPDFEKYGFLGSADFDKVLLSPTSASNYGNVCVRLNKSTMADRVTYTFGDSLNELQDGRTLMAGGLDRHLSITGIPTDSMASSYKKMRTLEKKTGGLDASDVTAKCVGKKGYIEAQLHGSITIDDVSEVVVEYTWNGKEYVPRDGDLDAVESLIGRLQDMGLPVSRVSVRPMKDPDTGDWVEKVVRIHDRHSVEG